MALTGALRVKLNGVSWNKMKICHVDCIKEIAQFLKWEQNAGLVWFLRPIKKA